MFNYFAHLLTGEVNSAYTNQEYLSNKKLIANMQPQLPSNKHLNGNAGYLAPYSQAHPPIGPTLTDVEGYSEYSQRTRSSYKSSGPGSNHNSHLHQTTNSTAAGHNFSNF